MQLKEKLKNACESTSKLQTPIMTAHSKYNNWNFRNDMDPLSLWDCDPQQKRRALLIMLLSILLVFSHMFSSLFNFEVIKCSFSKASFDKDGKQKFIQSLANFMMVKEET